jgi:hypothetical protein
VAEALRQASRHERGGTGESTGTRRVRAGEGAAGRGGGDSYGTRAVHSGEENLVAASSSARAISSGVTEPSVSP